MDVGDNADNADADADADDHNDKVGGDGNG